MAAHYIGVSAFVTKQLRVVRCESLGYKTGKGSLGGEKLIWQHRIFPL
jgi:hypothetical protein